MSIAFRTYIFLSLTGFAAFFFALTSGAPGNSAAERSITL